MSEPLKVYTDAQQRVMIEHEGQPPEVFLEGLSIAELAVAVVTAAESDDQVAELWTRIKVNHPCGFPIAFEMAGRGLGLEIMLFGAARLHVYERWPIDRTSVSAAVFDYPRRPDAVLDACYMALRGTAEPARWYRADRRCCLQQERRPEFK